MESKMSASIGNIASNLVSFIYVILWCVLFSWIFAFQDFYFCFLPVIRSLPRLFLHMSKGCRDLSQIFYANDDDILTTESCSEQTIVSHVDATTSVNFEVVEIIFEKLGLDCGARKLSKRNKMERQYWSNIEVGSVFDTVQPCLDEVREAFNIFDANNDGFIDANELEKVINSMGFMKFSREEYQRMIMAFDHNGDGKIDFEEFVKLMQDCSY